MSNLDTKVAVLQNQMDNIEQKVDEGFTSVKEALETMNKKMDDNFVSKVEFWPVKTIVYAGAGIVLSTVVLSALYLIIKTQ